MSGQKTGKGKSIIGGNTVWKRGGRKKAELEDGTSVALSGLRKMVLIAESRKITKG